MDEESKKISITGTHNKYIFKKFINKEVSKPKKREITKKWSFSNEYFENTMQLKLIKEIN